METPSKKHEMAYRTIQGFTLLGGGLLWYELNQIQVRPLEPDPEVIWAVMQCLKFLSGLGSVAALLSLMVPPIGRPVLRGYYIFFALLFGLTGVLAFVEVVKSSPWGLLIVVPEFALVLGLLAAVIKTLGPPKDEAGYREV